MTVELGPLVLFTVQMALAGVLLVLPFGVGIGFWLARVLPVWATVALILVFEIGTAFIIRDGLALNVLMLLYPLESVMEWQSGGGEFLIDRLG